MVNPNMRTSYATGDAEKSGVLGEWCISIFFQENNSPIGLWEILLLNGTAVVSSDSRYNQLFLVLLLLPKSACLQ